MSALTTPPWFVQDAGTRVHIVNRHVTIATLPACDDETLADARLMAAAPDLLEALREAADMLDVAEFPEGGHAVAVARAAIAKATGG